MGYAIDKLNEVDYKLKQYEDLIEDLIEFSEYCLKELDGFGSDYAEENKEVLTYIEKRFKKIKGKK